MRFRSYPCSALWIALTLVSVLPKASVAQEERRVELAGGYSSMRDYDGGVTFPRGWFASVAMDVADPVAVVGEASGSYKSMGGLDVKVSMGIHTLTGGPRLVWRIGRIAPYGQMLLGVARFATTYELPEESVSGAQHHFTMAPGGGIDVRFSDRGAVRVGTSLRLIRSETFTPAGSEPFTYREFQFLAGVVYR